MSRSKKIIAVLLSCAMIAVILIVSCTVDERLSPDGDGGYAAEIVLSREA
jgi:hypothetical protein